MSGNMEGVMAELDNDNDINTKACPFCGELIKRVAVRCKHCQADLSTVAKVAKVPEADFTRGVTPPKPETPEEKAHDFEVRFLEFAYQTTSTINVPAVAHALKLPTAEVNDRLEDMAARDVLVREIDDEGNVYFLIPGRSPRSAANPPLATTGPGGQMVHISAPAEGTAVAAMVLNVFIPGAGSLVAGRTSVGMTQLLLWVIGFPLCFVLLGFPILMAAWVWSLVTGIQILEESRRRTAAGSNPVR
jgi:TM2 domain-containing membrane protein YozV